MSQRIHPTAQIHPSAKLADDVSVGAFSLIGEGVEIGAGTVIHPHVVVEGPTRIGKNNQIYAYSVIGTDPQDKKYQGEQESRLEIGDDNVIREYVSINRGTEQGGGVTRIGDRNWLLAYVHIAHDCIMHNDCVMSNNSTLAGHVEVGNFVTMSGFCGIHQFCRIGDHAFIGMGAFINADVAPFVTVAKEAYAKPRTINAEGMRRRGFSADDIATVKRLYRLIFRSEKSFDEVKSELAALAENNPLAKMFSTFVETAQRPILR